MAENVSLRNEIDIEIPYVNESGVAGIKKVHIAFISQKIYNGYVELMNESREAISLGDKINNLIPDLGYIAAKANVDNSNSNDIINEVKEKSAIVQREVDDAIARITEIANHTYEKKFALIKQILIRNSIEDKDLYDLDWWMSSVEMSALMRFLYIACNKDEEAAETKKKE